MSTLTTDSPLRAFRDWMQETYPFHVKRIESVFRTLESKQPLSYDAFYRTMRFVNTLLMDCATPHPNLALLWYRIMKKGILRANEVYTLTEESSRTELVRLIEKSKQYKKRRSVSDGFLHQGLFRWFWFIPEELAGEGVLHKMRTPDGRSAEAVLADPSRFEQWSRSYVQQFDPELVQTLAQMFIPSIVGWNAAIYFLLREEPGNEDIEPLSLGGARVAAIGYGEQKRSMFDPGDWGPHASRINEEIKQAANQRRLELEEELFPGCEQFEHPLRVHYVHDVELVWITYGMYSGNLTYHSRQIGSIRFRSVPRNQVDVMLSGQKDPRDLWGQFEWMRVSDCLHQIKGLSLKEGEDAPCCVERHEFRVEDLSEEERLPIQFKGDDWQSPCHCPFFVQLPET